MTAVEQAIKRGLTPRAVEHAYLTHTIAQLAELFGSSPADLTTLAKRWGVGPYEERK